MGNIMVRMGVVIGVVLTVQLGFLYVGHLSHPDVVEPQRSIEEFPMTVNMGDAGKWEGKNAKLDDRSFNESEVSAAVSRIYTKAGRNMKFLLAEYKEPSKGLYHNPMNCYYTHGFTQVGKMERQPLTVKDSSRPDTTISLSVWQAKDEKVIVAYWYEVGDYTMFERQDLLGTQWKMLGKTKWPVMFKVLLEMPADDQSSTDIMDMAQYVRQWLGTIRPVMN
jgi:hypothetical protein